MQNAVVLRLIEYSEYIFKKGLAGLLTWGLPVFAYIAGALPWSHWLMRLFPHIGTPYTYSPAPLNLLRFGHLHQGVTLGLVYLSLPLLVFFLSLQIRPDTAFAQYTATAFVCGHLLGTPLWRKSQESMAIIFSLLLCLLPLAGFVVVALWLTLFQASHRQLLSQLLVLLPLPLVCYFWAGGMAVTIPLLLLAVAQLWLHRTYMLNLLFLHEAPVSPPLKTLRSEAWRFLSQE